MRGEFFSAARMNTDSSRDLNLSSNSDEICRSRCIRKNQNPLEAIMLPGQATVESVIEEMKFTAYDYLIKPCRANLKLF
jgi:DNA-binding NtrC family response regulator